MHCIEEWCSWVVDQLTNIWNILDSNSGHGDHQENTSIYFLPFPPHNPVKCVGWVIHLIIITGADPGFSLEVQHISAGGKKWQGENMQDGSVGGGRGGPPPPDPPQDQLNIKGSNHLILAGGGGTGGGNFVFTLREVGLPFRDPGEWQLFFPFLTTKWSLLYM